MLGRGTRCLSSRGFEPLSEENGAHVSKAASSQALWQDSGPTVASQLFL